MGIGMTAMLRLDTDRDDHSLIADDFLAEGTVAVAVAAIRWDLPMLAPMLAAPQVLAQDLFEPGDDGQGAP